MRKQDITFSVTHSNRFWRTILVKDYLHLLSLVCWNERVPKCSMESVLILSSSKTITLPFDNAYIQKRHPLVMGEHLLVQLEMSPVQMNNAKWVNFNLAPVRIGVCNSILLLMSLWAWWVELSLVLNLATGSPHCPLPFPSLINQNKGGNRETPMDSIGFRIDARMLLQGNMTVCTIALLEGTDYIESGILN